MTQPGQKMPTQEQIKERAFELYLQRGGQHGGDLEDWLEAEKQLARDLTPREIASAKQLVAQKKPLARAAAASVPDAT